MAKDEPHSEREAPEAVGEKPTGRDELSLRRAIAEAFDPLRRFMYLQCGAWHEAEDVAQEALLRAWRSRESFDGRADPRTWIFAIARNHWRDRLRRLDSGPRIQGMSDALKLMEPAPGPAAAAGRGEIGQAVRAAMARLPSEQREALALRESQGLTFREIAAVSGVPIPTAKSRVRYALLKLAEELKNFRPEAQS